MKSNLVNRKFHPMSDTINETKQWEQSLLSSFLEIVQAPDGDFTAINQLVKASSDSKSLQLIIQRLSSHPQGKQAFEQRFSLSDVDLAELSRLPNNTLGYMYADHMLRNQLKPLQATPAENDFQFLAAHITETHDIWHVVTGSNTDVLGEIQLEAFYVAQLEGTRFWLALLAKNLLKSALYNLEASSQYMDAMTKGWSMGKKANPLFGVDWATLWETPIEDLRADLNLEI
jgi:ubiquinone biosynthesis protein Coq4